MLLYDLVGFEFHSQVLEFVWLTTWVCIKPGVNNGISYLSTGAGFLPSTVSLLRGSLFFFSSISLSRSLLSQGVGIFLSKMEYIETFILIPPKKTSLRYKYSTTPWYIFFSQIFDS